ncbi:hypothetical protein QNH99_23420 (plasmid) [Pantoea allii]|uniref:hypothetical protein n=1 Tax=Pantoea allii TaxID=574096 RepID=UPI003977BED7
MKIEDPMEVSFSAKKDYDVWKKNIEGMIRASPEPVLVIAEPYHGNPAFREWVKKLSSGEKLPRGKFFRKAEIRRWIENLPSLNVHGVSTVHFIDIKL